MECSRAPGPGFPAERHPKAPGPGLSSVIICSGLWRSSTGGSGPELPSHEFRLSLGPVDVKKLRSALALSQAELAALLGAHTMTVSKWERGKLQPSEHHRRLLGAFARAAERGGRFDAKEAGRDPVRFLSQLLDQAYRAPQLDLGTLSATNRFAGRVVQVARGDVMSKVVVEIAPGIRIGSVITTDSVDRLGLQVGSPAIAIIKATEVILASA